eukprot:gene16995-biopygen5933
MATPDLQDGDVLMGEPEHTWAVSHLLWSLTVGIASAACTAAAYLGVCGRARSPAKRALMAPSRDGAVGERDFAAPFRPSRCLASHPCTSKPCSESVRGRPDPMAERFAMLRKTVIYARWRGDLVAGPTCNTARGGDTRTPATGGRGRSCTVMNALGPRTNAAYGSTAPLRNLRRRR